MSGTLTILIARVGRKAFSLSLFRMFPLARAQSDLSGSPGPWSSGRRSGAVGLGAPPGIDPGVRPFRRVAAQARAIAAAGGRRIVTKAPVREALPLRQGYARQHRRYSSAPSISGEMRRRYSSILRNSLWAAWGSMPSRTMRADGRQGCCRALPGQNHNATPGRHGGHSARGA